MTSADRRSARPGYTYGALIDGTWVMPGQTRPPVPAAAVGVPWFDIDLIAHQGTNLPHMLPTAAQFENAMTAFGISNQDHVGVYDRSGMFAAPRLWWTFKAMGHEKVALIEGDYRQHLQNLRVRRNEARAEAYAANFQKSWVVDYDDVVAASHSGSHIIIDARPAGRFFGRDPEPRPGLPSGHIPGSINIPFATLKQSCNTAFKPRRHLVAVFENLPRDKPIITTCGSGVTAAGLAWALDCVGFHHIAVYDGSWVDYASRPNSKIEKVKS